MACKPDAKPFGRGGRRGIDQRLHRTGHHDDERETEIGDQPRIAVGIRRALGTARHDYFDNCEGDEPGEQRKRKNDVPIHLPARTCCNPEVVIFSLTALVSKTALQEGNMRRIETISFGIVLAALASPAFAGTAGAPAPVVGVGVGAVVLVGLGYRALKARVDR